MGPICHKPCLNIWTRSAKSYEDLLDSNILKLPSGRNLRRYKNAVIQESGIFDEIFHWIRKTAEKANFPDAGYYGGILHDEANIRQDLIINCKGNTNQLIGWVDTGDGYQNLKTIKDNQIQKCKSN